MTTLGCSIKREQAAKFKDSCQAQGKTANAALRDYVLGCIGEEGPQEPAGDPTMAPAGGGGLLSPDTLKAAQRAAEATGETPAQFIARAIVSQIRRDETSRRLGLNPVSGERLEQDSTRPK